MKNLRYRALFLAMAKLKQNITLPTWLAESVLLKFSYIVLFFAIVSFSASANTEKRNFTLVIDAGHGGHDAGAVGSFSKEKNINLNVALAFGRLVEDNCPDVKVIYTRKKDVFIPLQGRADIANRNKADLFISIHTNALPNGKQAYGSETYTLGMARASANLAVAKRENSVITMENDYKTTYQGFDPNKAESYVIFEFMQDRFMKQSVDLASSIQKQYKSVGRPNKGVHQAGFLVLRNTSMPSVLTELGFITTPQEETYLNSQQGIAELSQSIYNGFLEYRRLHDRTATDIPQNVKSPFDGSYVADQTDDVRGGMTSKEVAVVPVAAVPTARLVAQQKDNEQQLYTSRRSNQKTQAQSNTTASQLTRTITESQRTSDRNNTATKPVQRASNTERTASQPKQQSVRTAVENPIGKSNNSSKTDKKNLAVSDTKTVKTSTKKDTDKSLKKDEALKKGKEKTDVKSTSKETTKDKKGLISDKKETLKSQGSKDKDAAKDNKQTNKTKKETSSLTYRIQVGAGKREIETNDPQFKGLTIKRVKEGSMYKYFYGSYHTYAEAQKALRTVKEKLASAYIVAYESGKSLTVSEARAKEKGGQK